MNGRRRKDIDRKVKQRVQEHSRDIVSGTYRRTLRRPLRERLLLAFRIVVGSGEREAAPVKQKAPTLAELRREKPEPQPTA